MLTNNSSPAIAIQGGFMAPEPAKDPVAVRLPRTYDVELMQRDLQALQEVRRAAQPGPYHKGEWTGIALYSMGGKQSVFPSAAGTDHYQENEELERAASVRRVLDGLDFRRVGGLTWFLTTGGSS